MSPSAYARNAALWPVALALLLVTALSAGCTLVERQVLSVDEDARREVALLTNTSPAEPPPAPGFRQLTALDVEASLRRLVVRPSTWISFLREEPKPLLDTSQLAWARAAIVGHLPGLKPEQRLQLRFEDRFHGYEVEVEIYAQGDSLVYRFTKLADQPENVAEQPVLKPVHYVELQPQPGQALEEESKAVVLSDPVLGRESVDNLARNVALLEQAVADGKLEAEEIAPARAVLEAHPAIGQDGVQLYLEKLVTVHNAQDQGLFSADEADARRARLLQELKEGAAPKP